MKSAKKTLFDLLTSALIFTVAYFLLDFGPQDEMLTKKLIGYLDFGFTYIVTPFVILELLYSFLKKDGHHESIDTRTNFIVGAVRGFIEPFLIITVYVHIYEWGNRVTGLSVDIYSIKNWIIGFLLLDLCYYWDHRLSHEYRFLWANHSVHHSSHKLNFLTSSRGSWIEGIYRWIFRLPMALIGFNPFAIILMFRTLRLYQLFQHTDRYLGDSVLLRKIFVTPESHRLHHAQGKKYYFANYGGIFSLYDHLFKTTQVRDVGEVVTYGISDGHFNDFNNANPLSVVFSPLMNHCKFVLNTAQRNGQKRRASHRSHDVQSPLHPSQQSL